MEKLRAGDESTWRAVFYVHYPVMCYYASQFLGDDFLAKAVASDVMSHLWEIRHTLQISTSLRSYLLHAIRNKCLDYLKSNNVSKTDQLSVLIADDMHHQLSSDPNDIPISKILEKELEDKLAKAISELPEDCRMVFEKSRYENLKYKEIAQELGISVNTVKYHMKRALSLLREKFGKYLVVFAAFFFESMSILP